jgi:hypothetical protein
LILLLHHRVRVRVFLEDSLAHRVFLEVFLRGFLAEGSA